MKKLVFFLFSCPLLLFASFPISDPVSDIEMYTSLVPPPVNWWGISSMFFMCLAYMAYQTGPIPMLIWSTISIICAIFGMDPDYGFKFGTIISLLLSVIVQIVGWDMAKKEYW